MLTIETKELEISFELKRKVEILLPENSASLLKGILLGDCTDISSEVKENFKECNLSHMLAVSGAHLSYLIIGINLILSKKIFGKHERQKDCICRHGCCECALCKMVG